MAAPSAPGAHASKLCTPWLTELLKPMECLAVQNRVRTWGWRPFKPFAVPLPVGHRWRLVGEFVAGRPTQVLLPPMQTPLYSTCCPKSFLRHISPFFTSREEWIFVAPQFKNTCAKKNAYLNLNGRSQPSSEPPIALPVRMHRPWSVPEGTTGPFHSPPTRSALASPSSQVAHVGRSLGNNSFEDER